MSQMGTFGTSGGGSGASAFVTDAGTANQAAGSITIAGGANLNTSGAGSTVTINMDTAVTSLTSIAFAAGGYIGTSTGAGDTLLFSAYDVDGAVYTTFITLTANNTPTMDINTAATIGGKYIYRADGTDIPVADGGTGASTLTDHGVLLGSGVAAITATAVGATNTVLLGNTGADPSFGTVANAALTNSSTTLTDGANITVTGSPVSLGGAATIAVSGTTDHAIQIGNATGSLTSLAVGTNGQVLIGSTGADAAFASLASADGSVTFTPGANTLDLSASGVNTTFHTDAADATEASNAITIAGTASEIETSGAGSTVTIGIPSSPSLGGTVTAATGFTSTNGDITITAGNLVLPDSTSSSSGVIVLNAFRFLHNYGVTNHAGLNGNIFVGEKSGNFTMTVNTAYENTSIGSSSLCSLTTGNRNTALGSISLTLCDSGICNVAVGQGVWYNLTSGNYNSGFGFGAGVRLTTGTNNTLLGVGYDSGYGGPVGAGYNYTSSESHNILIMNSGVTGESNKIRIGTQGTGTGQQDACYIAGIYNTAVGATAGIVLSDSSHQLGGLAGAANTVLIGGTKPSFTGSPSVSGSITAATGFTSTNGDVAITAGNITMSNTTSSSTGVIELGGERFLHNYGSTTQNRNVFIGYKAGNFSMTVNTAFENYGIGHYALNQLTTGSRNNAMGYGALFLCTEGTRNIAHGSSTLYNLTTGDYNSCFGFGVSFRLTTGSNNTLLGVGYDSGYGAPIGAGYNYTSSESHNILIMNSGVTGESNKIRIGTQGTGTGQQDACYIAGIYNTAVGATAGIVLSDSSHQLGGLAGAANTVLIGGAKPSFTGSPTVSGTLTATNDVKARTLFATGDEGTGVASTTAVTNVVNTALSSGTLSIKSTTANPGDNAGFIKAYIGTTVVYIPYFSNIAP